MTKAREEVMSIDAVPTEERSLSHDARVHVLSQLRSALDAAVQLGMRSGLGLHEMVILILTAGVKERAPFPLPESEGARFYILSEPLAGFEAVLKHFHPTANDTSLAFFRTTPPAGFVHVAIVSIGGFTGGAIGRYVTVDMPAPGSANN